MSAKYRQRSTTSTYNQFIRSMRPSAMGDTTQARSDSTQRRRLRLATSEYSITSENATILSAIPPAIARDPRRKTAWLKARAQTARDRAHLQNDGREVDENPCLLKKQDNCIATGPKRQQIIFVKEEELKSILDDRAGTPHISELRVDDDSVGSFNIEELGVRQTWKRLIDGQCGIVSIKNRSPEFALLPSQVAGIVPEGKRDHGGWDSKEHLSPSDERRMARFAQYAMVASEEALKDSEWFPKKEEDLESTVWRIRTLSTRALLTSYQGVYMGSGIGSLDDVYNTTVAYEKGGYRKVSPLFVPRLLINLAAGHISMRYGFKGPNHAATTACTTGAHSIGDASRLIQFGDADIMIAGGAESCIHPLAISGFARARSLATDFNDRPTESSRPFDRARNGFVIGEGAGVMVLEELEHAKNRGAQIYAEVAGYGLSSDAYHMTAPREDGQGPRLAMKHALRHAGLKPSDVDYVNAHATSTPLGDAAENRAIKELLLGEDGKTAASKINISSTKGAIGHLLGAAGSVEAIFTVLGMHHNILPPTLNLNNPGDPPEDFDCNYVAKSAQQYDVKVALSNSFGFGGTNASLCFRKVEGLS
ncbi:FabB, 3-oxoacyl-(acyl-carrier-protein) synthase [Pyrenophora tritici-repentis]|uniref:3-oxoacyl-[acyl-carrier-protein] synthase, mitochondrial n=1 Tax=Pyrenophora tritici-repentis TaxID=45151 RepID=A0A834RQC5_9PLEO|nr:FabB, 3-oxoacyl-(acyl-carrier-protein) synthase [Pyrenophora tritici-repentis]